MRAACDGVFLPRLPKASAHPSSGTTSAPFGSIGSDHLMSSDGGLSLATTAALRHACWMAAAGTAGRIVDEDNVNAAVVSAACISMCARACTDDLSAPSAALCSAAPPDGRPPRRTKTFRCLAQGEVGRCAPAGSKKLLGPSHPHTVSLPPPLSQGGSIPRAQHPQSHRSCSTVCVCRTRSHAFTSTRSSRRHAPCTAQLLSTRRHNAQRAPVCTALRRRACRPTRRAGRRRAPRARGRSACPTAARAPWKTAPST